MGLATVLFVLLLQTCLSPAPGPGWVCQDGGWFPPGHPLIRPQSPQPEPIALPPLSGTRPAVTGLPRPIAESSQFMSSAELTDAAWTGKPLPSRYVSFTPPLLLKDIAMLRGEAGRTVLVPNTTAPGPLVILESTMGHIPRQVLQDLMIECTDRRQIGLTVNGSNISLERLTIFGCDEGLRFSGVAVNVAVRDCLFSDNRTGVSILGYGPSGLFGPNSVTTLRFSGVRIVASSVAGMRIGHGIGIVLDDSTIIENNAGVGILIEPSFPLAFISVLLRDVWFEQNGTHVMDPYRAVRYEGLSGERH